MFLPIRISLSLVKRNVKRKGASGEYDIVAVGENRVLVVEVKKMKLMECPKFDDAPDLHSSHLVHIR